MKKVGLIAGISFLAGALFFALTFGYLQKPSESSEAFLSPAVAEAETVHITGMNFAPIVKKVKPAVVQVISEAIVERRGMSFGDDFFDRFFNVPRRRQKVSGAGSGFFISKDGYIITNNHVVEGAIKITVIDIDNNEYTAKKIGTDPKTDLALLKVDGKDHHFIELGDSNNLEVGEWVLAIGNPFGQSLTVTSGIVSATGRKLEGLEVEYQNFIQTDAAINHGNSGGPLINMEGKAVGINSVILSNSGGSIGIGFAIPSNMAKKVMNDLKKEGRVIRGYLGVSIQDISDKDAKDFDMKKGGILIGSVEPASPAEQAGIKQYDVVIEVNGQAIDSAQKLKTMVANQDPGDKMTLKVLRGDKEKTFTVTVGEAPDTVKVRREDEIKSVDLGMVLVDNNRATAERYNLETHKGILVREVNRGSNAYDNGLKAGDVILRVNRVQIENVEQFRKFISSREAGSRVMLIINRDGNEYMLRYRLPE